MRLHEHLLLLALIGTSAAAHADPLDLKPFRASYSAEWKGLSAGTSVLELKTLGSDTYSYSTTNTARGLFRMAFPDALTQTSTFRLSDERIVPLTFRGEDDKQRAIDLTFDWSKRKITGTAKGHAVELALPADAHDSMSLQISSLRDLAAGRLKARAWMIDGDKLKEYELRQEGTTRLDTALGELDTIIYSSQRANSDRVTRTWVAPALGYLPVKAERVRGKKIEFTLLIDSIDR